MGPQRLGRNWKEGGRRGGRKEGISGMRMSTMPGVSSIPLTNLLPGASMAVPETRGWRQTGHDTNES